MDAIAGRGIGIYGEYHSAKTFDLAEVGTIFLYPSNDPGAGGGVDTFADLGAGKQTQQGNV